MSCNGVDSADVTQGLFSISILIPRTFETDFVSLERHVRIVEVGTSLDDQIDSYGNLFGDISSTRQVNGEGLEGDGDVAFDWNVEMGG